MAGGLLWPEPSYRAEDERWPETHASAVRRRALPEACMTRNKSGHEAATEAAKRLPIARKLLRRDRAKNIFTRNIIRPRILRPGILRSGILRSGTSGQASSAEASINVIFLLKP